MISFHSASVTGCTDKRPILTNAIPASCLFFFMLLNQRPPSDHHLLSDPGKLLSLLWQYRRYRSLHCYDKRKPHPPLSYCEDAGGLHNCERHSKLFVCPFPVAP